MRLTCPTCRALADECMTCGGSGAIDLAACAWDLVTEDALFVCRAAGYLEVGIAPWGAVDWPDWPATFDEALGVIGREREAIKDEG